MMSATFQLVDVRRQLEHEKCSQKLKNPVGGAPVKLVKTDSINLQYLLMEWIMTGIFRMFQKILPTRCRESKLWLTWPSCQ